MSHYTTQVRWIVENATPGFTGSIRQRIAQAAPSIFNFDFPMFQENHRLELEIKILSRYYMREIGFETVGLWKLYLETRLNEIMPYFNELYAIEANKFDYLQDIDVTDVYNGAENANYSEGTTHNQSVTGEEKETGTADTTTSNTQNRTGNKSTTGKTVTDGKQTYEGNQTSVTSSNGTSTDATIATSSAKTINTDFPQAPLSDLDYASEGNNSEGTNNTNSSGSTTDNTDVTTDITSTTDNSQTTDNTGNIDETGETKDNGSSNTQTSANKNSSYVTDASGSKNSTNGINREHNLHRKGKSGPKSYTELMVEYRNAIINIDTMIINNLHDLFMQLY